MKVARFLPLAAGCCVACGSDTATASISPCDADLRMIKVSLLPLIVLLVVGCDTSSGAKVAASVGVDCTVGSVTVSPASASMLVGDSAQLTAKTPPPPCGTGGGFFWRSSNSAVATVDSTGGKVRAVAVGQATIIALLVSDTAVKGAGAITVNSR